jgi:hypothetical protein
MTDKNTYWISDGDTAALVTGADERDRLLPLGWTVADEEPTDGWVHIWHYGIEQPGRVPVSAVPELWAPMGWVTGPPPGGVHPFAPTPQAKAAESKPQSKPAAGGSTDKE